MNSRTASSFLAVMVCFSASLSIAPAQPLTRVASEERERGVRLYNEGKTKEAVEVLRGAVKRDNNDGDAWYYLGIALIGLDDLKNARKALESALKLKPDFGPAHTGIAYCLAAAGKDTEAAREASNAIALNSPDAV